MRESYNVGQVLISRAHPTLSPSQLGLTYVVCPIGDSRALKSQYCAFVTHVRKMKNMFYAMGHLTGVKFYGGGDNAVIECNTCDSTWFEIDVRFTVLM